MNNFHLNLTLPRVESIDQIIHSWPAVSRRAAHYMVKQYGLPNEATASMLVWHRNGAWKKSIVHREGVVHNFPLPHEDILEQTVDYRVPLNKHDMIVRFDGSLIIDRTRGELSVHCDSESSNRLMLNLAHDIAVGRKTVDEARRECDRRVTVWRLSWSDPYTQKLQFSPDLASSHETDTPDPDVNIGTWLKRRISTVR